MGEKFYVATRKGLLTYARKTRSWSLEASAFVGDPVTFVLRDARDGALYAALNLGHFGVKLRRSRDGGKTWQEIPAPAFPADRAADSDADAPAVSLIWSLAAGGTQEPGVLWAGTIPGGLFRSGDSGETWSLAEELWNKPERARWFGGGYDHPGIHSICVDPRDHKRISIAISSGGVLLSDDGGTTWRQGGHGLRAAYMPPEQAMDPVAQDPHLVVQCLAAPDVMWCQHHNGIFHSKDRGANFTEIESEAPSRFGFAVAVHPRKPDTAWFVPAVKDECRVPVDQKFVARRTDAGGESFTVLSEGLPQTPSFDLVYRHGLDVDATGDRLVMGTTTGNLWISENGGNNWQAVSQHLPPINHGTWVNAA